MDSSKLEVIKEWTIPKNLHELRRFIAMCAYHRCFIGKLSFIASPLHDLTKKNVRYEWTKKENDSFETLKEKLISQPILILLDLSKPFEVQCDACASFHGAILL